MSTAIRPKFDEQTEKQTVPVPTPSDMEAQQDRGIADDPSFVKVLSEGDSVGEGQRSRFVVDWDGENDPANPMNWPKNKRILQVILVSAITMVTLVFNFELSLSNFANKCQVRLLLQWLRRVLRKSWRISTLRTYKSAPWQSLYTSSASHAAHWS